MMTSADPRTVETLAKHRKAFRWSSGNGYFCGCGKRIAIAPEDVQGCWEAHLAEHIEPVIRAREQESLRQHREDWASWIDDHGLYVGTVPLTQEQIIEALLRDEPPFGSFANPDIEAQP